jgi:hypothetical protein
MNKFYYLILALVLLSCKKEEKQVVYKDKYEDNVAPCNFSNLNYQIDSVFYGASQKFPNAVYRIKFIDTSYQNPYNTPNSIEFAFNKVPTTGVYYSEKDLNPSLPIDQVAFKHSLGAYGIMSMPTEPHSIYVENNSDRLIISFCNQSVRVTDPDDWTGNLGDISISMKVNKEY